MEVADDVPDLFVSDSSESSTSDEEELVDGFEIDFIISHDGQTSDEEYTQPRFGGYEYEFVDEVSDSQKCPVCLLPMRDAVQTLECGHRFCKDCLQRILRDANPVCPNDRLKIQKEGGYFPDKAWARDILCLRVKCKRNDRGCDWIGELGHAENHKGECDYEDEKCLACDVDIQRRLKETHHNEECPKRIIECVHCQDEFTFIQKQEHEDTYCRRFPLVCTNNCGHKEIPREEMEWHLSYKCPMTEVTCPYAKAGCPFQDKRAHLNDHIEVSVEDHLELTWSSLVVAKQELDNMKDLQEKFHEIQEVNKKLMESMADSREEVRDLTLTVKSLEIQNIQLKKSTEDMARQIANYGILTESMAETHKEVLQLKMAIKNLEKQDTRQKTMIEGTARNMTCGMKSLEIQMDQVKATLAREKAQAQAQFLSLPLKSIPTQPMMPSPYMSPREESKKVQDTQESPASEKAQFPSLQKSIAAQPVMLASPPSSSRPYMSPREESKKVQDTQESLACEKVRILSLQKSISTQPVMLGNLPSSSSPYMWPREESKKDTQESNLIAQFALRD